jgi:alkylation response protein AidB-like acyl-CoA dehydrogenase
MATADGWEPRTWRALAESGALALHLPPPWEGGGSFVDTAAAAEHMGGLLIGAPFLSTVVLAASALALSGDRDAGARHLPGIVAGSTTATLAFSADGGRRGSPGQAVTARRSAAGFVLDGHASYVLDGHTADLVLVAAGAPAATSLFTVDARAPGLTRTPLVTLDQTRKLARLELAATPATLVGPEGGGGPVVDAALDLGAVALAAEAVGGARRCLDMAVAHARSRVQFGRPIGAFQAVKHKLADVLVAVESARSVAAAAARAAAAVGPDLALLASVAKAHCAEAFVQAASESIQVHGGIGLTWDHDAQLYLKRARSSAVLLGDTAWHRQRVARLLGL